MLVALKTIAQDPLAHGVTWKRASAALRANLAKLGATR
jgi:hypothetical protein